MALTAEEILEHAKALPPRERLELVERVVHSLVEAQAELEDMPSDEPPNEEEMDRELARRIRSVETDSSVSAEDVIARLRARG